MIKIAYRIVVKWISGLGWSDFLQIVGMVANAQETHPEDANKEKRDYVFDRISSIFKQDGDRFNWGTFVINVLIELAYSWFRKQQSK